MDDWELATDSEQATSGRVMSQTDFHDDIVIAHCASAAFQRINPGEEWDGNLNQCASASVKTCENIACALENTSCIADVYAELADAIGPTTLTGKIGGSVVQVNFEPLELAERALLMERGYYSMFEHLSDANEYIPSVNEMGVSTIEGDTEECLEPFDDSVSRAGAIEGYIRLISRSIEELAFGAMEAYTRLADSEAGSIPGPNGASTTRWELRRHAGSIIAGPSQDTGNTQYPPFCDRETHSPSTLAAIEVIRQSGVDPVRLAAIPGVPIPPLSLTDFLFTGPHSVRTRYFLATTGTERFPASGESNLPSQPEFYRSLGLTDVDFMAARQALVFEILAYRRPFHAVLRGQELPLPPESMGMPSGVDKRIFSATRRAPFVQSWLVYASGAGVSGLEMNSALNIGMMRRQVAELSHGISIAVDDATEPELVAVADATAGVRDTSLMDTTGLLGVVDRADPPSVWEEELDPEDLPEGVYYDEDVLPSSSFRSILFWSQEENFSDFRMTNDVEQLHCAIRGISDAGPCTSEDMQLIRPLMSAPMESGLVSPTGSRLYVFPLPTSDGFRTFYLLRPTGGTPDTPRGYVELGLIEVPHEFYTPNPACSPGSMDGGTLPDGGVPPCPERAAYRFVQPDVDRRAAELLMPSQSDCGTPQVTCIGTPTDARLPLEDSLTDDGDAHESSWRTYLQRARQAADRADELGRIAQGTELNVEERSEAAIEQIQTICGSAISIDPLTRPLPVACAGLTTPFEIAQCLAPEDPAMSNLVRCLSEGAVRPFVSLGNLELCIWHPTNDEASICGLVGDTTTSLECPRQPTVADDGVGGGNGCVDPDGSGSEYVGVRVRGGDLLNLFAQPVLTQPDAPPPNFCEEVRGLRRALRTSDTTNATAHWIEVFRNSEYFTSEKVKSVGRRITWRAKPGSFAELQVDGETLLTTGDIGATVPSSGICDESGEGFHPTRCSDGDVPGSLFCSSVDCTDVNERAMLNGRMLRAAMMARWLAQHSAQGFVVPYRRAMVSRGDRSDIAYLPQASTPGASYGRMSVTKSPRSTAFCQGESTQSDPLWVWNTPGENVYDVDTPCIQWSGGPSSATIAFYELPENSWGPRAVDETNRNRNSRSAFNLIQDFRDVVSVNSTIRVRNMPFFQSLFGVGPGGSVPTDLEDSYTLPWKDAQNDTGTAATDSPGVRFYDEGRARSFDVEQVMDGLELICEAGASGQMGIPEPRLTITADQFGEVIEEVKHAADLLHGIGNRMVFNGMPVNVVESLQNGAFAGSSGLAGSYGAETAMLRASVLEIAAIPPDAAAAIRAVIRSVESTVQELNKLDSLDDIQRAEYIANTAVQLNNCMQALFQASDNSVFAIKGSIASALGAIAQCATSAVVISSQTRVYAEQQDVSDANRLSELNSLAQRVDDQTEYLRDLETRLRVAATTVDGSLIRIRALRQQAHRALAQALFMESDNTGALLRVNSTLHSRLSAERTRYRRAEIDAIRISHLAKRAIEQRFGVTMSGMVEEMTLVERPASWESRLCETSGIDESEGDDIDPGHLGDYVTLLENFVESYRLDYPFSDGFDTAVVSLRDDVQRTRAFCEAPVGNLLYYSGDLASAVDEVGGWEPRGCFDGSEGEVACMSVEHAVELTNAATGALGVARPFRLTFAPGHPDCPGAGCPCLDESDEEDEVCGWRPGATYGQSVDVSDGLYRVSWYERSGMAEIQPVVDLTAESPHSSADMTDSETFSGPVIASWQRRWRYVSVPSARRVRLEIAPSNDEAGEEVVIAGVMLERHSGYAASSDPDLETFQVPLFSETTSERRYAQRVCEDTDGEVFRGQAWNYSCEFLCDDGFEGECAESGNRYCFWETTFSVTDRMIQRGEVFSASGFARGNFNYRADTVAVNFVGTGSRDCSDVNLPSTCYSAGFIPYSLEHFGPYTVQDYEGAEYVSQLFSGRIEHARGLAAERYISNPLSGADQTLIQQFTQSQMRGRPLTGTYRLRVWDEPGVNFEGIEDVQIVLGYRFWTRSN